MLSIIHNLYKKNPFVRESVYLNLKALNESKIPFEYILFNDNGDKSIYSDINEFLNHSNVKYIYSSKNFGQQQCSGGWIGALSYVKGEYINNIGQDDVFTSVFYRLSYEYLETRSDTYLVFSNCFKVRDDLTTYGIGMNTQCFIDYHNPIQAFMYWFGVKQNRITCANNNMMAPGVVYRISLHKKIGTPDIDKFRGASDFEYWSRVLFNEFECHYLSEPTWMYRQSDYTAGNAIINGKPNRGYWQNYYIQKVKEKYLKLWEEKNV